METVPTSPREAVLAVFHAGPYHLFVPLSPTGHSAQPIQNQGRVPSSSPPKGSHGLWGPPQAGNTQSCRAKPRAEDTSGRGARKVME